MSPIDFAKQKNKRPLSMVTCYDSTFAKIISHSDVDAVLVGDSGAMVMGGQPDTTRATLQDMCFFTASVARGLKNKLLIADMPFLTFRKSIDAGMDAAHALIQAGAHALKVEGVRGHEQLIERLVLSGLPVMGHLGLTPQSVHGLGGYHVQGRTDAAAQQIEEDAKNLQALGIFSLVLECVPTGLAGQITRSLQIPTIGIGAGPDTDGQVLVLHDLLGLTPDLSPRFVRKFLNGGELVSKALAEFHENVVRREFPSTKESYL